MPNCHIMSQMFVSNGSLCFHVIMTVLPWLLVYVWRDFSVITDLTRNKCASPTVRYRLDLLLRRLIQENSLMCIGHVSTTVRSQGLYIYLTLWWDTLLHPSDRNRGQGPIRGPLQITCVPETHLMKIGSYNCANVKSPGHPSPIPAVYWVGVNLPRLLYAI